MTHVYTVIGSHQNDPDRLLLLGSDGRHYQYEVPQDRTTPVELSADDDWRVDPDPPPVDEVTR